ncbi:MAG: hypothetical protein SGILL_003178 [Bacillariaceae sp.]
MWNGGGGHNPPHYPPYYSGGHPMVVPNVPPSDPRYPAALAMLQQQQQAAMQHHAATMGGHLHPSDPRYAAAMAMSNGSGQDRSTSSGDDSDDDGDDQKPAAEDEDNDADEENDSSDDSDDDEEEQEQDAAQGSVVDEDDEDDGFGHGDDDEEEEEDGSDDDDDDDDEIAAVVSTPQPRGKPEAMAKKLASAVREQALLEEEQQKQREAMAANQTPQADVVMMSEDAVPLESLATHSTKVKSTPSAKPKAKSAAKKKKGEGTSTKRKSPAPKKKSAASTPRSRSSSVGKLPTMDEPVEPITDAQYQKLDEVMKQFCKVPLLAEFSRPVAVLHPELMNVYSKIVEHPIDLGKVCRRVRRRQYDNLRDIRLDTWRIFTNCFKYHSSSSNKQAVPSFVSIALHLRDLFNDLWQEHMLPSDFPPPAPPHPGRYQKKPKDPYLRLRNSMEQRAKDRKRRLVVSGLSVMNGATLRSTGDALVKFVENGGRVDKLDIEPIWGEGARLSEQDESDVALIVENLKRFGSSLREMAAKDDELGVDDLDVKLRECYTKGEGFENMSAAIRMKIANRLGRFVGQILVPINEANCRGVSQSSVWGCMAAAVWARESSKKPFWPALVLGIMAPDDQKEDWHSALTERNETRLPSKLKILLSSGKRRAEQALKRQGMGQAEPQSYFLVEFLGTHEFIWVREADIVENFNPEEDPNKADAALPSRKKRIPRSTLDQALKSETYAGAIEEAQWALEEFEMQLQDIGGESEETPDTDGQAEGGYSFPVLSQSDEEAEGEDHDDPSKESIDIDECNELLATNGLLDLTVAGRKKRALIVKQQKLDTEKKKKAAKARKDKADKAKRARDAKEKEKQKDKEKRQAQRELENKRRKRMREREKALKNIEKKNKRMKLSEPSPGYRRLINCKRERAEAVVNGFVHRTAEKGLYKSLSLGGGEEKWIPTNAIDSNNLSGIALAFRAAAGLVPTPNPTKDGPGQKVVKPWDEIKINRMKMSDERMAGLEKQIELIEKEIQTVKAQKERRLQLLKAAKDEARRSKEKLIADDEEARSNPMEKRPKHWAAGKVPAHIKSKSNPQLKKIEPASDDVVKTDSENLKLDAEAETGSGLDEKQEEDVVEVEAVDSNDDDDDEEEEEVKQPEGEAMETEEIEE